ncbi:MAG: Gfo/Idh/MocA family oxidoreductase [Deltaproteobacteria bacterium]
MSYRASIIGCGRVAWMLEDDPLEKKPCTHMGAYLALGEAVVRVSAASDISPERAHAFGRRYSIGALYADYMEMLQAEAPQIVSICAYAPERYRMVMDSIEAGVKGIWCEKAFATNMREAGLMIDACAENGVSLVVSHLRRWSPDFQKAKELIDSGGIGRLQYIAAHFSGSLMHTGTHAFDVLNWFCGPAKWVSGGLEPGAFQKFADLPWDVAGDSGGWAVIMFENNAYATVHADSKPYFFFEFDIVGSQGRIRIGNNDLLEYYTPETSVHYTGLKELSRREFPAFENRNIWVGALKNLIDAMEGRAEAANGPVEGLKALEIALAIHESARTGGGPVELPLRDSKLTIRSR